LVGYLYRRRVEMALEELKPGQKILEIGFGTGLSFLNLNDLYQEIWGLDLTVSVEDITRTFTNLGIKTNLQNGDVLKMPYPDNSFDSVLLISILEHLQPNQQDMAFKEIKRVLKPGGQLVYGVPVERPLMTLMFSMLGVDIRDHHFSTEKDVHQAALQNFTLTHEKNLNILLFGTVYQIGHYCKTETAHAG
jgi:ubiquinone/menaquinone biosynthesis C-methylase UbiE